MDLYETNTFDPWLEEEVRGGNSERAKGTLGK